MTNPIPGADSERDLFDQEYIAEFGDPCEVGLSTEFAWISSAGIMWRKARAAAKVGANVAATRAERIYPPDFPAFNPAGLEGHMSPSDVWDYACLVGWRCGHFAAGAPAETPKPIQRHATDVEIAQWAERHDLGRSLGDSAGMMRAAFEDAESLHQTYAAQPSPAPIAGDVEKDAARLDFIEKNARSDPKMDGQHVWWPTAHKHALRGPTLRAAIDAAMLANSSSGEAG